MYLFFYYLLIIIMENIENIEEHFETLKTIQEIVEHTIDPRTKVVLKLNQNINQSGGGFLDAVMGVSKFILNTVKDVFVAIFTTLRDLFDPRIFTNWRRESHKSGILKYIFFSVKCGLYLVIFAIAGPIFMLIGISMIYIKLYNKMGEENNGAPS